LFHPSKSRLGLNSRPGNKVTTGNNWQELAKTGKNSLNMTLKMMRPLLFCFLFVFQTMGVRNLGQNGSSTVVVTFGCTIEVRNDNGSFTMDASEALSDVEKSTTSGFMNAVGSDSPVQLLDINSSQVGTCEWK
jgi:hypothetical protein